MSERWSRIPGLCAEASNRGRIRSGSYYIHQPSPSSDGYVRVTVQGRTRYVHRLVWSAFHGRITRGQVVDHRNSDRSDNRLSNLRLVTQQQNARLSSRRGRLPRRKPRVLTFDQVRALRKEWGEGVGLTTLSRRYGIKPETLYRALTGISWAQPPRTWIRSFLAALEKTV